MTSPLTLAEECMRDDVRVSDIEGFPGYQVTEAGHVQSKWRRGTKVLAAEWRNLKPGQDAKGYGCLTICNGTTRRPVRVHRLVAEAFVPNPDGLPCVRHLDGDPSNNAASNLAWGSYAQNERDKHEHGTYWMRLGGRKLSDSQINEAKAARSRGESQVSIATRFGVSRPTITRLLNGSTWSGACAS